MVDIKCRLCPFQILGKRATSVAFKSKATLRMLALETSSVDIAREAVRSLLTDMGVESTLWTLPAFDGSGDQIVPKLHAFR